MTSAVRSVIEDSVERFSVEVEAYWDSIYPNEEVVHKVIGTLRKSKYDIAATECEKAVLAFKNSAMSIISVGRETRAQRSLEKLRSFIANYNSSYGTGIWFNQIFPARPIHQEFVVPLLTSMEKSLELAYKVDPIRVIYLVEKFNRDKSVLEVHVRNYENSDWGSRLYQNPIRDELIVPLLESMKETLNQVKTYSIENFKLSSAAYEVAKIDAYNEFEKVKKDYKWRKNVDRALTVVKIGGDIAITFFSMGQNFALTADTFKMSRMARGSRAHPPTGQEVDSLFPSFPDDT